MVRKRSFILILKMKKNTNKILTNEEEVISILVVDDDPFMRDVLFKYLTHQDYQVTVAESGFEALEQIRQKDFHFALIDMVLPKMDGLELIDQINEIRSNVMLIIMTGHPSLETALKALKKGVQDYLIKPFNFEQLSDVLSKCLEKRRILLENQRLKIELEEAREQLKKYEAIGMQSHHVTFRDPKDGSANNSKRNAAYREQSMCNREITIQERIDKLTFLKESGVISEDDYEYKVKQLASLVAKVSVDETVQQKKENN